MWGERVLHHALPPEPLEVLQDEKLVPSMAGLWRDETRRRKKRMGLVDSGSSPFPPEVLVSMSAGPRVGGSGGWIHEEEYRELVEVLVQKERAARGGGEPSYDDFVAPEMVDGEIRTLQESVVELFQATFEAKIAASAAVADGDEEDDSDDAFGLLPDTNSQVSGKIESTNGLVNGDVTAQLGEDANDLQDYGSDEDVARELALSQRSVHGHTPVDEAKKRPLDPEHDLVRHEGDQVNGSNHHGRDVSTVEKPSLKQITSAIEPRTF